ncbi:LacI family transcriptional regulator [Paracoccus tegillarcae]|uniref:LacI family transcriptional regulator n=1 Tax=Paracoccus tegillarcae TaxID=1529068 RepID=A0A2K9EYW9_9RHOB|nr:LacI family transcriptional regulator [Paracoccus tegillarcae]AUH33302.1 LacI family transcriptional regulator [Paracoccus tegillarcae]
MPDTPATSQARSRVTLRTIAGETGLAVTTVSRALSNDPRIAQSTRTLVTETALRLGYVPDRAAQRLRTGRTKVIQILLNLDHEFLSFTHEMIGGLSEVLSGTGYSVTLFPDILDRDRLTGVRQIVDGRLGDGVIFNRTEPFDPRVRYLTEQGFPFVCHGRTQFTSPHPFVDYDNEAFARLAVERLLDKGRRRMLIILPGEKYSFAHHLRWGAVAAARAAGVSIEMPDDITLDSPQDQTLGWLKARLAQSDRPDGIICVGEIAAMTALAAIQDCGLRVGQDIDVVAKQASDVFDLLRPRIDIFAEDLRQTGRDMGEVLLRSMAGEDPARLQVLHQPQFIAR